MEQLGYNLLFRWFVGLSLDAAVWDVTVFTKNRERLIDGDIVSKFMAAVLNQERVKTLLSDDHFSVDGTLIEAWASMKSFRPTDGSGEPPAPGRNGERDFHGEKRSNETHASANDPDARLYRKGPGQPAKLAYLGHVLMENRHALERPETWVTDRTGHMGNTFPVCGGGVDAVEGVFGNGRAPAVRCSAAGRRSDEL